MLVDITLRPSRMQQVIHWLALAMLAGLLWFSGLAWPLAIVLIGILLGLHLGWPKLVATRHITMLWQGDSQSWYWQYRQGRRYSGQLLQIRYLGPVIHLTLTTAHQPPLYVAIWRDQVDETQWRRLKVLNALNDSQQNWF